MFVHTHMQILTHTGVHGFKINYMLVQLYDLTSTLPLRFTQISLEVLLKRNYHEVMNNAPKTLW